MGAVPKKKPSLLRSRRRRRAFQDKVKKVPLIKCANCGRLTLPHRVCAYCGQYQNREYIAPKLKVKKVSS